MKLLTRKNVERLCLAVLYAFALFYIFTNKSIDAILILNIILLNYIIDVYKRVYKNDEDRKEEIRKELELEISDDIASLIEKRSKNEYK
jgi:hypothetical protein